MSPIRRVVRWVTKGDWRIGTVAVVPIVALAVGLPIVVGGGSSLKRTASPAGTAGSGTIVRHDALPAGKTPAQVRAFWTPKRIGEAKPIPLRRNGPPGLSAPPPDTGVPPPEGAPMFVPPDQPGGGVPRLRKGTVSRQPMATIPFERFEEPNTTSFPARVHGKLFFEVEGNEYLWLCSATVVTTSVQKVIFTAGHCIYTPENGWSTAMIFVPGYRNESAPYGTFVAERITVGSSWYNEENFSYDIGAAELTQTVEQTVGARGIAFNQPRQQHFDAWGYPAASPFDGERLYVCSSNFGFDDPLAEPTGPPPMGIGCDMTGGSSGGGWVIHEQWLNSVNSFGYSALPEVMFGPYFGDFALGLYESFCCGLTGETHRPHTLSVSMTGTGSGSITSSPGGINCPSGCSAQYEHGKWVALTPTPSGESTFEGWSGCDDESGTTCNMFIDANRTVTAFFHSSQHTLSASLAGSGSGSVSSNPPGLSCPPNCSAQFSHGQSVTLTAAAAGGSSFAGWGGVCSGTGPCNVTMIANQAVTATFNLTGGGEGGGGGGAAGPPNATITRVTIKSAKRLAKFSFKGSGGSGARRFSCKLDKKGFAGCGSPKTYKRLKPGKHTFKVKAIDSTGQADPTPAATKFKILR